MTDSLNDEWNWVRLLKLKRCRIVDLKEGMGHLIVMGRINSLSEPKEIETRYGKSSLVTAELEDETGKVLLNLFGEQINLVKEGDIVVVENGYTIFYDGKLTLSVPKYKGRILTGDKKGDLLRWEALPRHSWRMRWKRKKGSKLTLEINNDLAIKELGYDPWNYWEIFLRKDTKRKEHLGEWLFGKISNMLFPKCTIIKKPYAQLPAHVTDELGQTFDYFGYKTEPQARGCFIDIKSHFYTEPPRKPPPLGLSLRQRKAIPELIRLGYDIYIVQLMFLKNRRVEVYVKKPLLRAEKRRKRKRARISKVVKEEIKKKIVEMYSNGIPPYKISEQLAIQRTTLNYWLNKFFPHRKKWQRLRKAHSA